MFEKTSNMENKIRKYLAQFDLDIRKSNYARFMDQKVTPDVLSIIADCVLNYDANQYLSFSKNDIWSSPYFNENVKYIFNKPDASNKAANNEYDKFISQPLLTLAYAQVLSLKKQGNINIFQIKNKEILEFVALKERNAYRFLVVYLNQILDQSNLTKHFHFFKNKSLQGRAENEDYCELRDRFIRFIIGNTPINGEVEVRRIFPKILNIYACHNNIQGVIRGRISTYPFIFSDLMYNRVNWRDKDKNKSETRTEADLENKVQETNYYNNYLVQKAISFINKHYKESEVKDSIGNGIATHVHHIFMKSQFPELASYLENLIKLTPTQHLTKAHPNNNTSIVDRDYQLICLLSKADSIEKSLNKGEFFYSKESFIYVINTGLDVNLEVSLSFERIKTELTLIYNKL